MQENEIKRIKERLDLLEMHVSFLQRLLCAPTKKVIDEAIKDLRKESDKM